VADAPATLASPAAAVPMPEQSAQASRPLRRTVPLSQELSMDHDRPAPTGQQESPYFAMNMLIREMAEEVRSLHQQAWDLEQRLLSLTETFDRAENTPSRRLAIDEEVTEERAPSEAM
jgi:hypothetical protein